ncbi:MAG: chorismate lyase [Gammaproteobacteria bacterium]|nr:chorismate lyase [Gammaproteobacteria bacterium]
MSDPADPTNRSDRPALIRWYSSPLQPTLALADEPGYLLEWLLQSRSLTRCLKTLYGSGFRVELLGQHSRQAGSDEAELLNLQPDTQLFERTVVLRGHDEPLVFARSLLPASALSGAHGHLAHLGSRPLGELLFDQPDIQRKSPETACIHPASELGQAAAALIPPPARQKPLWARRTRFQLDCGQILVMECFLPGILAIRPPREP